ncbi:MAG TPA: SpoIIE family protein phosphatase [Bryobacteraceae bacterium]|nr:SpoIIE family protein phosphatase [Bryobacteraceae bacterium]
MARELSVTFPDGATKTLQLEADHLAVGRAPENDLAFPEDIGLSRHHFRFEKYGDDWLVRDLLSKNGTFVNGARISEPVRLRAGDRVTASRITAVYEPVALAPQLSFDAAAVAGGVTFATNLHKAIQSTGPSPAQHTGIWRSPMDALVRAGRELAGRQPLKELFPILLDLAIEAAGAQRGVLATAENGEDTVQAQRGNTFRISRTVRDRVLEGKDSVLVKDTLADAAFSGSKSIVIQGVRSFMAAPLQTEDRVLGLIYVDSPLPGREFTTDDLNLLTVMANVAAIRIERERLVELEQLERMHERELAQAAEIQTRLLPESAPVIEGFQVAGYNAPCRTVGGDYYDFLPCSDGRLAIVVADVAGKGLPASLMMSNLQAKTQAIVEVCQGPSEVVNRLNRGMARTCPGNRFVTLFYCVVNTTTGELTYSNAGHNPPMLVHAAGGVEQLEAGGPVLGILPMMQFQEATATMASGDVLVLYSDGVTEAANGQDEEFGEDRLLSVVNSADLKSADAIVAAVHQAVRDFTAGQPQADDITVVAAVRS